MYCLTGGLLYLACRWFPRLELFLSAKKVKGSLISANLILAKNNWGQIMIIPIRIDSDFCGTIEHVFPNFIALLAKELYGTSLPEEYWKFIEDASLPLKELRFFEYRYHTLVFNPITLRYHGVSDWRDLKWDSIDRLLQGVVSVIYLCSYYRTRMMSLLVARHYLERMK
jgi:hypothetical protein